MAVDVARFIRLKGAVVAAGAVNNVSLAGKAMADTYDQLRDQIRAALPKGWLDEFDPLFPRMEQRAFRSHEVMESAAAAEEAKAKLITLAGYLQGAIDAEEHARH